MNHLLHECRRLCIPFFIILLGHVACRQATTPDGTPKDKTTPPPKPHMWKDYNVSRKEESNYKKSLDILVADRNNMPETDSIYYDVQEFTDMIDSCGKIPGIEYLDVYFAVFGAEGSPFVPGGSGGKLTPLFVPADSQDHAIRYFLLPEGAISFSPGKYDIPATIANNWISNYTSTAVKWLDPLLDAKDSYNYKGKNTATMDNFSNTLQVHYFYIEYTELETEIKFQASANGDIVSGVKFFFAEVDSGTPGQQGAYSNRLLSEFEFTQDNTPGVHSEFYIDTTQGFGARDTQPPLFQPSPRVGFTVEQINQLKGFDNGALCPPTCN